MNCSQPISSLPPCRRLWNLIIQEMFCGSVRGVNTCENDDRLSKKKIKNQVCTVNAVCSLEPLQGRGTLTKTHCKLCFNNSQQVLSMVRSIKHLDSSFCVWGYVARSGGAVFKGRSVACNSLYAKHSAASLKKEICCFMIAHEAQVKSCSIMCLQFKTFCWNLTLGPQPLSTDHFLSESTNRFVYMSENTEKSLLQFLTA